MLSHIENGIEGYRFYTLKLEEMREMRIPNVTMQDLIQLNAAIYRLNVSCASPANRSHMTGTLRTPTQGTQGTQGTKSMHPAGHPHPHTHQHPHSHSPQQTAQALPPAPQQPSRPPRSAKAASESTLATHANAHLPTQQYALPAGSSQILARPLQPLRPPGPSWTMRRDSPQPTHVRPQVHLTSNGMVARPTPIPRPRDAPSAIDTKASTATAGSGGTSAGSGGSAYARATTYRSRDSAHVESDELHLVRPGQATWSAGQARQMAGQLQQQQGQVRRRSAVIEMFDEQVGEKARVGRAPGRSAGSPTAATAAVAAGLPARYHGTNQAHSAYYAHGASSVAGSGVISPPSLGYRGTPPYRPPPPPPALPPATTSATASGETRSGTMRVRRASLSPELTALLQPGGGYHIANLPDSSDSSDSNTSDNDTAPARRQQQQQHQHQQRPAATNTALPPRINTSLAPTANTINTACDTGDSTITPLSVVNVVGGLRGTQQMRLAFGGDLDDLASASVSAESADDLVEQSELSDLIGDAAEIDSTAEIRSLDSVDVWDAEEIESDAGGDAGEVGLDMFDAEEVGLDVLDAEEVGMCVFDAEEVDDDEDGRSSVHIDAYETA
ncbi:hypothetical protein LPJ53_006011, partial [Coemansia erecta]